MDSILIRGAREHNLKDIDVAIPRGRLVVVTGLSGSGKSSLAFDTLYAEGQRRYVESLSAYARQFLDQMPKPDVDAIEGLSPALSIEQKSATRNPRSTVGTVTEIYDHLRLLYARAGRPHCWQCDRPIAAQTVQQMVDRLLALPEGARFSVLAPIVRDRKGEHRKELERLRREGFTRVAIDGEVHDLGDEIAIDGARKHTIEVYVDRLVRKRGMEARLADSVELAARLGDGLVKVALVDGDEDLTFSQRYACPACGVSYPEVSPRLFSFNSPHGACPDCHGLGERIFFDPERVVPDPARSLRQGAIAPWEGRLSQHYQRVIDALAAHYGFDVHEPWSRLPERVRQAILSGSGDDPVRFWFGGDGQRHGYRKPFEGVIPNLERRLAETQQRVRESGAGEDDEAFGDAYHEFAPFQRHALCPTCEGTRLRREVRFIRVGGRAIHEVARLTVREARAWFEALDLSERERAVCSRLLRDLRARLGFLDNVGVEYLTLDRSAATLSGGEWQRIRLATQVGSSLTGVLYVLDEPSIGLHPRDHARLLATLTHLRDLGNTVLVVEHDEATIRAADHVIDMGPGAGVHGGRVVAEGPPEAIARSAASLTGAFLSGRRAIELPGSRRPPGPRWLTVRGARANNLKGIDARFPLGALVAVTGVSGSGKSTLVVDTLLGALRARLAGAGAGAQPPGAAPACDGLDGAQHLDKVVHIDQGAIGRTPRSNPATYTGLFSVIRDLFAGLPDSRVRGYRAGRYSFNVKGGRCEACRGDGVLRIEMHFLPDVHVTCEQCGGRRYDRETLEVKYRGRSIADVLDLTVEQALELFAPVPKAARILETVRDVGLGYVALGQSATTLSGGEAQRIKLSRELARRATGRTLYLLDEPTTGLHFADIAELLRVLARLVDAGNTVIVIEHHLDVIKTADWIVDLGPEGGEGGGRVVAAGTPEEVAACDASHTGRFLRALLPRQRVAAAAAR